MQSLVLSAMQSLVLSAMPQIAKGMGAAHAAVCRSHAACRLCFAERRPESERFAQPANWLL